MSQRIHLTTIFIFLLCLYGIGQSKVDSLRHVVDTSRNTETKIKALIKLTDQFQNPNDKLIYGREAYRLSQDAETKTKIVASNKLGICHGMLGNLDSSRIYFSEALEFSIELGDSSYISSGYNGLGNIARMQGSLEEALNNFIKALDYSGAVASKQWPADILTNISGVHYDLKNYDAALEKVMEARKLYIDIEDEMNMSYTANLLAILYRATGDLEKSYRYNQEALEMLLVTKDTSQIIYNYINSTEILIEQNKLNQAAENAKKTIKLASKFGDRDPQITSLLTLSSIYFKLGRIPLAEKYVLEGIRLAVEYDFRAQLPDAYMLQSLIESAKGNHQQSFALLEKYETWTDSIRSDEIAKRVSELDVQYETEKKEREIDRLNAEREIKNLEIAQIKTRNILLSILAIIFVIASGIILILYRQKLRINAELKAINQTKDHLFSIVAHDIKNPLSAFKSFVGLWGESHQLMGKEDLDQFILKLDQSASGLLDLLQNLLEWSITQTGSLSYKPEKLDVNQIIDETISLFQGTIDSKNLGVTNEVQVDTFVEGDFKMIYSIVRNLLSNAVKFTPDNGSISFKAQTMNNAVEIIIKDSGIGMTPEQVNDLFVRNTHGAREGTGLGLILCKEFIERNRGTIDVKSAPNEGTSFIIRLESTH